MYIGGVKEEGPDLLFDTLKMKPCQEMEDIVKAIGDSISKSMDNIIIVNNKPFEVWKSKKYKEYENVDKKFMEKF